MFGGIMKPKKINIDRALFSSDLGYMRDYKKDYNPYVLNLGATGNIDTTTEYLPWTVPKGSITNLEVHDTYSNRWYELSDIQIKNPGNVSQSVWIMPIVKGTQAGFRIRRYNFSGSTQPAVTLTFNLRTMIPPFTET